MDRSDALVPSSRKPRRLSDGMRAAVKHGEPTLSSDHGVCVAGPSIWPPDAYDWNFCWKVWDALRRCALDEKYCNYAVGDTRRPRSMGLWSDGVPVTPLKIQDAAPIFP
jgi:hypothetical protein